MEKELLWELFKQTGKIEYYMAWKKEEQKEYGSSSGENL